MGTATWSRFFHFRFSLFHFLVEISKTKEEANRYDDNAESGADAERRGGAQA
jgi:hypothetical protein